MSEVVERDCLVCRSKKHRTLFRTRLSPGPIVQCSKCGMIYVNPCEHPEWFIAEGENVVESGCIPDDEAASERYYLEQYLLESRAKLQNFSGVLENMGQLGHSSGQLLEIGCYCGLFLQLARSKGWTVKGIEPEVTAHRYAVSALGLDVHRGTLRNARLPGEAYDAVVMLQVLEHILDPRAVLEESRRVLSARGLLAVEVPNIDCWGFRLAGKRHRHFARHHVNFFSPPTLTKLLESIGFEILRVVFPARVISLSRLIFGLNLWYPRLGRIAGIIVNTTGLGNLTVSINLRDIIAIYARPR